MAAHAGADGADGADDADDDDDATDADNSDDADVSISLLVNSSEVSLDSPSLDCGIFSGKKQE